MNLLNPPNKDLLHPLHPLHLLNLSSISFATAAPDVISFASIMTDVFESLFLAAVRSARLKHSRSASRRGLPLSASA